MTHHMSGEMQQAAQDTQECADLCSQTVMYCLEQGGAHAEPQHVRLLLDCAEVCRTSKDLMLRGSEFSGSVCGVCADVCERCAEDCARFTDDRQMQQCAEVCRRCAASCRTMAGMPRAA